MNGKVVENPDLWIDFHTDRVLFDGKPLRMKERVYILLHKPAGYITTFKDPEGRPTVYDLIPKVETFVSPVGRLDLDTSGLLILTNDTQFAERLTNPDHKVPKTYLVKCADKLTEEALQSLRDGVELSDGPTKPAIVRRMSESVTTKSQQAKIELTITEGRNRQVRRMIEAVGTKVVKLTRTSIGPITIGDLPEGASRELTPQELHSL